MLTPVELLRHYVVKGKDVSVDAQGFVRFVGSNIAYPKNTKTNIVATSQNPNSNEREYVNENCYHIGGYYRTHGSPCTII